MVGGISGFKGELVLLALSNPVSLGTVAGSVLGTVDISEFTLL
jgi:hypothetical protein